MNTTHKKLQQYVLVTKFAIRITWSLRCCAGCSTWRTHLWRPTRRRCTRRRRGLTRWSFKCCYNLNCTSRRVLVIFDVQISCKVSFTNPPEKRRFNSANQSVSTNLFFVPNFKGKFLLCADIKCMIFLESWIGATPFHNICRKFLLPDHDFNIWVALTSSRCGFQLFALDDLNC